jgi:hypothetical protein
MKDKNALALASSGNGYDWYNKSKGYTKAADGMDRSGHAGGGDLVWTAYDGTPDKWKTGITLEDCKKACTAVDDCIGISYNDSIDQCYMKDKTALPLAPSGNNYQWYAKN